MSAAVAGGENADRLRALYDRHAAALQGYVVGLTAGDQGRAEDIVQETFLRAWRNAAVLEQVDGYARGWLFTVAKRIVIDEWRSARRRRLIVTDEVPEQSVPDPAARIVTAQVVRAALRALSSDHRQVLFEGYFRGASVSDVAERLGLPSGTVKSRTHYALRALRRAIDQIAVSPGQRLAGAEVALPARLVNRARN